MKGLSRGYGISSVMFSVLAALAAVFLVANAHAGMRTPPPELKKSVVVGDRVVDIAYNLGVLPEAMSVRGGLWPMAKKIKTASEILGCPNCVTKKRKNAVPDALKKRGIEKLIISTGHNPYCLYKPMIKPENVLPMVKGMDIEIEYVDFSKGLESAVQQTAELLDRKSKGTSLINEYNMKMERTKEKIKDLDRSRKVLIINGIYQRKTGRVMLQVEAPGGYADQFLLDPLECENVGGAFQVGDKEPAKGHYRVPKSRKGLVLDSLVDANPDIIVMTGNAFAIQKAISSARKYTKGLDRVSAIQNNRLYALPGYIDASVIEYPMILRMWADAMDG